MTLKNIIEIINLIERNFPVENWKINGIHVWPCIRSYLAETLRDKIVELHEYKEKYNLKILSLTNRLLSGLKYSIESKLLDNKNDQKLKNKYNVLFLTNSSFRRSKIDGKWYDIYSYPIIEELTKIGLKSYVLELSRNYVNRYPRYNETNLIEFKRNVFYLLEIIKSVLKRKKNTIEMVKFEQLENFLHKNNFKINVPELNYFVNKILKIQYKSNYYENYIRKTKCTIGIVNGYGSDDGLAFCLACSKVRIKSIEIQHGMISEMVPRYGKWSKVPESGYALLPNIFWTWSEFEAKFINEWATKHRDHHRALKGGFFWANKWRNGEYDQLIKSAKNKIFKNVCTTDRFIILVALQSIEFDPTWLKKTMLNSPDHYYWLIRFHPSYDNDEKRNIYYKYFAENKFTNFEITHATNLQMMAILKLSNVLCTAFSSSVLDAKFMNVPSIVYHTYGAVHFKNEIQNGLTNVALTEKSFLKALLNVEKKETNTKKVNNTNETNKNLLLTLINDIKQ